jgi:dephospho-CoA kinase
VNIAVTGSLGSGKSTAGKILAGVLEARHVDTDQLCRKEMLPGSQGYEHFSKTFGPEYLHGDGSINRAFLRQAVFSDSRIRDELENILHPLVRQQVSDLSHVSSISGTDMVVEVPLLFEVGWQDDFDVSVVVYVPEDQCLARVSDRDGLSAEEIRRVFASQLPISLKLKYAHFVIDNSGTFVSTALQLAWLGKKLKSDRKSWESKNRPAKKLDSADLNTYKGNNDLKLNPCLC